MVTAREGIKSEKEGILSALRQKRSATQFVPLQSYRENKNTHTIYTPQNTYSPSTG